MTIQTQIVMPNHANSTHRLFGGQLVAWIDVVAAVEARRYAHNPVTTVSIDQLDFIAPAYLDEVVYLEAQVTWTGRTSLEVSVETFKEDFESDRTLINRAYLIFVALDAFGRPTPVPPLKPQTPQEIARWNAAEERRAHKQAHHPIIKPAQSP